MSVWTIYLLVTSGGLLAICFAAIIVATLAARQGKQTGHVQVAAQVSEAMRRKDILELRRLRLLHSSSLKEIDDGLTDRVDEFIADVTIEQDEQERYTRNTR